MTGLSARRTFLAQKTNVHRIFALTSKMASQRLTKDAPTTKSLPFNQVALLVDVHPRNWAPRTDTGPTYN